MATKRAEVISASDLSRSIDRAVALAVKRHDLKPEAGNLAIDWEIFGRRLRELQSLDQAFAFASDVTKGIQVAGLRPQPIALRVGRDIICGFIEKGRLPKVIGG
jgi:hypothetical protein